MLKNTEALRRGTVKPAVPREGQQAGESIPLAWVTFLALFAFVIVSGCGSAVRGKMGVYLGGSPVRSGEV